MYWSKVEPTSAYYHASIWRFIVEDESPVPLTQFQKTELSSFSRFHLGIWYEIIMVLLLVTIEIIRMMKTTRFSSCIRVMCEGWHVFIRHTEASVNSYSPSATYMRQWIGPTMLQTKAWRIFGEQYYVIVNWILRNKLQRNLNQNTKLLFIKMHL